MKKIFKAIIVISGILLVITWYTETKYNISPYAYWRDSASLNIWEKSYLSDKEYITYGIAIDSAPLSYFDEHTNKVNGILSDYMSLISIEIGVPVNFLKLDTEKKDNALQLSMVDTTDLFKTKKMKRDFIFTQELFQLEGSVLKRANDSSILRLRNLRGKRVAVISNGYAATALNKKFQDNEISIIKVSNIQNAIRQMERNNVDAVVGDKMVIQYYLNSNHLKHSYEILDDVLYSESVYLAVKKNEPILQGILNKSILKIKKKNLLPSVQEKWLGSSGMIVSKNVGYTVIVAFIFAILLLIMFLYLWDKILHHKISIATEELQDQRNSLRTVLDSVNLALFVINKDGTIEECNGQALKLVRCGYECLIGTNIDTMEPISTLYSNFQMTNSHNQKLNSRYFHIAHRPLSDVSNTLLIICEDITQKVIVDRQLNQKNKMAAIGQLSAGLAHEIRNPLGLIKNYSYIIDSYATDDISKHAIHTIDESVERINFLIENLLNYSKPGNERISVFNVKTVINNLLFLEKKKALKNNIRFEISVDDALMLTTSEDTFKIVISNLTNNALESLLSHPSESSYLKICVSTTSTQVIVTVEDNGIGIEPEKIDDIFNPFFTTKNEGTGLGLYIVSSELEKIDGSISVSSKVNETTIFRVCFPNITKERRK